jgi:hypothetical protein
MGRLIPAMFILPVTLTIYTICVAIPTESTAATIIIVMGGTPGCIE